ncbi:hypothetical protein PACTADRAFT_33532 [Pachysolen tannophilus NRRL Y-2460]|uniref:General negative regulator of transcription subunit n=1 Tax=Pachysolen tannophilus NRRL Y-2460 TaxID=669874 RepID=A0A1E4TXA1_PACTA|nr:hypothetical protein PACTADRAFT_33532 [Pachysolen tannophilus NRRL Y-2460]
MAQRKLQQEIDKIVKKVKDGAQEFDFYYEKLLSSENQSQKEKLEGDLKKEIKKLQRSRDQIKVWLSGNEVKDKSQLVELRKIIETDMEKFKDVEKEMKTKAFSKQGLNMQQKLDPREKEKLETANFVQSMIEELERQCEALEAKIVSAQGSAKKSRLSSKKQEEINSIQETLDRHNWHQEKMENILRLLENNDLEVDQIQEIEEDIKYYVENNQEDDFIEDDGFYDQLGLEAVEDYNAIPAMPSNTDVTTASATLEEKDLSQQPNSTSTPIPATPIATTMATTSSFNQPLSATSTTVLASGGLSKKSTPVATTPVSSSVPLYQSASQSQYHTQQQQQQTQQTQQNQEQEAQQQVQIQPQLTQKSSPSSTSAIHSAKLSTPSGATTPKLKYASVVASNSASNGSQQVTQQTSISASQQTPPPPPPGLTKINTNVSAAGTDSRESTQSPQLLSATVDHTAASSSASTTISPLLADLAPALENAMKRLETPASFEDISSKLETSLLTCPDSLDTDKPKNYYSTQPFATSIFYPQEPLFQLVNNTKNLSKYNESTLFYIFYNHKLPKTEIEYHTTYGEYLQYKSTLELIKRGWKFNREEQKWYHADEEIIPPLPGQQNPVKQQIWRYFDESDWISKRKNNFNYDETKMWG